MNYPDIVSRLEADSEWTITGTIKRALSLEAASEITKLREELKLARIAQSISTPVAEQLAQLQKEVEQLRAEVSQKSADLAACRIRLTETSHDRDMYRSRNARLLSTLQEFEAREQ